MSNIIIPSTSTAIPGPTLNNPILETTVAESLVLKKFLTWALADILYQIDMVSKDKTVTRKQFLEAKYSAELISAYLTSMLCSIGDGIKHPRKTQ
jgi:hypothetical protein